MPTWYVFMREVVLHACYIGHLVCAQLRLCYTAVACGSTKRLASRRHLPRGHSCSMYMILKLAKNQDEYLLRCDMASKLTLSLAAQLFLQRHDH